MTTEEFLASGTYRDFIDLDGTAFLLPPGYTVEPTPVETANIKTMASGRRRRDLIRLTYKFKLEWAVAPQGTLDFLLEVYGIADEADSKRLYLRKESPEDASDYAVRSIDIVSPVKYKHRNRVAGLFLYESVSIELE